MALKRLKLGGSTVREEGEGVGREEKSLLIIREAVTVIFLPRQRGFGDTLQVHLMGKTAPALSA